MTTRQGRNKHRGHAECEDRRGDTRTDHACERAVLAASDSLSVVSEEMHRVGECCSTQLLHVQSLAASDLQLSDSEWIDVRVVVCECRVQK